ncbi:ATP-binding protein [Thermodesulfobacteriota bacterium]
MKNPFLGLKAGILTQLIFLIVAAMLLINVAMLNLYESHLIREKEQTGKTLIAAVIEILKMSLIAEKGNLNNLQSNNSFKSAAERLLGSAGYSDLIIVNKDGDVLFSIVFSDQSKRYNLNLARDSIGFQNSTADLWGTTWGVLWLRKSNISISSSIRSDEERFVGGIAVSSSLVPVYELMRKSEKLIILYIILDTVILAFVGIYLLSRIVVKPIQRLLKMTEGYEDGEFIPSTNETPKNEIGNLSRSLSNMLKRLDENKKELKAHILSLEKTNNELKAVQNEIIRSEKLASVGRLAAGIAHEIGNPIGIILGYFDLIKKGNLSREEEKDFIDRVESEITRVNTIIRQLLDFSRTSAEKKENYHIHELVHSTVEMLKPQSMMTDLEVGLELKAGQDTVLADRNQIQQVFLNILINSIDSLRDEPRLSGNSRIDIFTSNKHGLIRIEFIDNGPGILTDELNHIFDPFFTTKDPGRGTGLGLSVCYRIVESHNGTIIAESSHNDGMRIIIELPLSPDVDNEFQGDPE